MRQKHNSKTLSIKCKYIFKNKDKYRQEHNENIRMADNTPYFESLGNAAIQKPALFSSKMHVKAVTRSNSKCKSKNARTSRTTEKEERTGIQTVAKLYPNGLATGRIRRNFLH